MSLLENLKTRLLLLLTGLLGVAGIILGLKSKKIAKLEVAKRADEMEKEVADLKREIIQRAEKVKELERDYLSKKSTYNHLRRNVNRPTDDGGDGDGPAAA